LLDQDLIKHGRAEAGVEDELSVIYRRLGQQVPAPDLSLYGSLGLGGCSRCVAVAPWAGWPPDRVAAAKISTAGHPPRHERGARHQLARRFWRPRKGACSCHARRTAGRRYRGGWTLAGVTQTIVRGHSGQRGVPGGPACNKCHVRAFVKLSEVTDTVAATRIGFGSSLVAWVCGLYRSPPCRCDGQLPSAPGTTKSPIWEC
jgi:hypothetical protein